MAVNLVDYYGGSILWSIEIYFGFDDSTGYDYSSAISLSKYCYSVSKSHSSRS